MPFFLEPATLVRAELLAAREPIELLLRARDLQLGLQDRLLVAMALRLVRLDRLFRLRDRGVQRRDVVRQRLQRLLIRGELLAQLLDLALGDEDAVTFISS